MKFRNVQLGCLILGLCVGAGACSESVPSKVKQAGNSDTKTTSALSIDDQIQLATKEEQLLTQKKKDFATRLSQLRSINGKLCERLFQHRRDCVASARLDSSETDRILGCIGNVEDGARMATRFVVNLSTANSQGTFFLRADNAYDSDDFSPGTSPVLKWKALGASDTLSPRLGALSTLVLRAQAGQALPPLSSISAFEVRVNDIVTFNKDNLIANGDSTNSYSIRLDNLIETRKSSACRVPDEEIDRLVDEGRKAASTTSLDDGFLLGQREELATIQARVDALKSDVGQTSQSLDREEDRSGKLTKELQGDTAAGCWAKRLITSMEIQVNGAHLSSQAIASSSHQKADVNNPRQFIFKFGDQFSYIHSDEEAQSLFISNGSVLKNDMAGHRIGDIENIIIEKGGVGIDSAKVCRPGGFLGLGVSCEYQNQEKNIYRLDSLTLKVNGEVLYRAEAVNFTFREGSLQWADRNVRLNKAFRDLMNRTDCPAE